MAKAIKKKETQAIIEAQPQSIAEATKKVGKDPKDQRNKRHGVATTEALWDDIKLLAEIKHENVNAMINRLLQEELDKNATALEKYKEFLAEINL